MEVKYRLEGPCPDRRLEGNCEDGKGLERLANPHPGRANSVQADLGSSYDQVALRSEKKGDTNFSSHGGCEN